MGVLTNPKHERFAQALVKGLSQIDAYTEAGYKPCDGHAARLAGNGRIIARLAELQERAAEMAECTAADIARQLDEDRAFAKKVGSASAMVAASMGKAKVLGLIVDKGELTGRGGGPIQSVTLSAQEFEERARRVAQEF